ncbi:MAG: D-alanyl-D-alanine carboxypeptidase, partial [Actinomycetota bacterium]
MQPFSINFNREGGRLVTDANQLARTTLTKIFEDNGIKILGDQRAKTPSRKLLTLTSPPLRELVASINKYSNNFMIEMLV